MLTPVNLLVILIKIYGMLDFEFFTDLKMLEGDDLHMEAVKQAMPRICDGFFSYCLEKATKKAVTKEEFLGSGYCPERDDILLRGRSGNDFLNKMFVGLDEEVKRNIYCRPVWECEGDGFCYAFSSPPYKTESKVETYRLYHFFLTRFLNDFKDELEIYQWSDDWSDYFESGKEWWGCYFWTIHNKSKNILIVIAGSTTD